MNLSIKTLNCDGGCRSCYEELIRKNHNNDYDIKKIFETIDREGAKRTSLHGGEPLLLDINDIESLLKHSFEISGQSGLQTGGHLITDDHIKMFKKYKSHVGISLDGNTSALNFGRWNKEGFSGVADKMTKKTIDNMYKLKNAGIKMSIISVLRKYNADKNNIDHFINFMKWLYVEFDIVDIRTNPGIVYEEKFKQDEELTGFELGNALKKIFDYCVGNKELKIQPIRDVIELLMGYNNATCNFSKCDPYYTTAEVTVNENGEIGNCLKSGGAVDGIQTLKSDAKTEERYNILRQIPEKYNGCKECKFWTICYGGCPGSGIDNDWRNRTRFCEGWKMIFNHAYCHIKGLFPNINLLPDYFPANANKDLVLGSLQSTWRQDKKTNIQEEIKKELKKDKNCINIEHGDRPHGDSHGDHMDRGDK